MTGSHRDRCAALKGREYRIDYSRVSDALFRCDAVRLTALDAVEQMLQPSGLLWTDKPRFLSFSTAALTGLPRVCEGGVLGRTDARAIRGTRQYQPQ